MKNLNIIIIFLLQSCFVFASENALMNPYSNKTATKGEIIDIGYQKGPPKPLLYSREYVELPAKLTTVNSTIAIKNRDIEKYSCSTDAFGVEVCPEDAVSCGQDFDFQQGYSEKNEKEKIESVAKEKIKEMTRPVYEGSYSNSWQNCRSDCTTQTVRDILINVIKAAGATEWDIKQYGGGKAATYVITSNHKVPYTIYLDCAGTHTINPGQSGGVGWKKIVNADGAWLNSCGGKRERPHFRFNVKFDCAKWETFPENKNFPEHEACTLGLDAHATCPKYYNKDLNQDYRPVCYKEVLTCPLGFDDKTPCETIKVMGIPLSTGQDKFRSDRVQKGSALNWHRTRASIQNIITNVAKEAGATHVQWVDYETGGVGATKLISNHQKPFVFLNVYEAGQYDTDKGKKNALIEPGGFFAFSRDKIIRENGSIVPHKYLGRHYNYEFSATPGCIKLVDVAADANFPEHKACADNFTEAVLCPDEFTKGTNTKGQMVCYKEEKNCTDTGLNCQKTTNYSYYDYKCNNEMNEQGFDYSIADIGGDCDGLALNANMECQDSTPPLQNCVRPNFTCPLESGNRQCSKIPTKENQPTGQKTSDKYIYQSGTAHPYPANQTGVEHDETYNSCVNNGTIDAKTGNCVVRIVEQDCPTNYIKDPTNPNRCLGERKCWKGGDFTDKDKKSCLIKKSSNKYSCPDGWEGPFKIDGKGNPPTDNCRKRIDDVVNNGVFQTKEFRPLKKYLIKGEPLNPDDFGEKRGFPCTSDDKACLHYVNKIYGESDSLCFEKGTGEKSCYKVAGCSFSGSFEAKRSDMIKEVLLTSPYELTITSKNKEQATIKSSCKMNGQVGWQKRKGGISSISAGGESVNFAIIKAKGHVKMWNNTTFDGFHSGIVALKLSDGYWYVSERITDTNGTRIKRKLPAYMKGLGTQYYEFLEVGNNTECSYNGVKTPKQCGEHLKFIFPGPKLEIIGVSDIDSLFGGVLDYNDEEDAGKPDNRNTNVYNLDLEIDEEKIPYKGSGILSPLDLRLKDKPSKQSKIVSKLNFWDSFLDGDLGFLEFTKEVYPKDKEEHFVVEKTLPYEMSQDGFFHSYYHYKAKVTVFVSHTANKETCEKIATDIKGTIIDKSGLRDFVKTTGQFQNECVIVVKGIQTFSSVQYAVKTNIFEQDSYEFICSPLLCTDHQCKKAKCPIIDHLVGGKKITKEYEGTILPDIHLPKDSECTDQVCDGSLPFVGYCGLHIMETAKGNVILDGPASSKVVATCPKKTTYNPKNQTCFKYVCPEGTKSVPGSKSCVKKENN